jgi:predicted PhzF superfamily epimerase YddE/YHI9
LNLDCLGVIVTAKGNKCDFVSRFFAPGAGVPEDPVTGSAHSTLIPFWADRLEKSKMRAKQVSQRGGELICTNLKNRVLMAGNCVVYSKAKIITNYPG